jgi:UDP-3-O-[3-hydroxymyristoyl] glucosamine N-acyltransferase
MNLIDESAEIADDVELGPFAVVGASVVIGTGSRIGAHVVIHDGTVLGSGCEVQDGAVLGKSPKLARSSTAPTSALAPLEIGDRAVVCASAIVFAGARLGESVIVGDQAFVRERAEIGDGTVVGRGSTVDNDVRIGARTKIQTDVYVTAYSVIEDDVFVGPGVCMTNDSTMGRHDASYPLRGPVLRRACRVGGGVVLTPGVEVGEEAFIAAGAVVTRDVAARAVVMGTPARGVRTVGDEDLVERWRKP